MGAYLIDHPPRRDQFRRRSQTISGVIVVHTAENIPDTIGPDGAAEAVARFIQGRSDPGSYHSLSDSDSEVELVPWQLAAYGDGTGSNEHAIHISAATRAAQWARMSREWKTGTVRNMARAAHRYSNALESVHGVRIPARRVTKAESDRRKEGFISHGERDPGRRSDPGPDFPWDMFFDFYTDLENPGGGAVETRVSKFREQGITLAREASREIPADREAVHQGWDEIAAILDRMPSR